MENTATHILTCPHCGNTKLISYSKTPWHKTDDSIMWSDGRYENNDKWCEAGGTQQCPSCKRFFTLRQTKQKDTEAPCDDTGRLPYKTLKQAITELSGDDKIVETPRLETWWAYNEIYKDVDEDDIPLEEREFNRSNMQWLLDYYNRISPGYGFMTFELLRLLGYEDEYRQKLANMTYENFAEWYCERRRRIGIHSTPDEELLREKHTRRVNWMTSALDKPLKPYITP